MVHATKPLRVHDMQQTGRQGSHAAPVGCGRTYPALHDSLSRAVAGLPAAVSDEYGCAIVKPVRSNRGRNVFLLRCCANGQVVVLTSEGQSLLDEKGLQDFANSRSESAWLVQRYIPSVDPQGRAFDVRIALFRADKGKWRIARSYARLGANDITSNLATGGSALDAGEFLATLYPPPQAKALTERLETAAQVIAEVLQKHYPFLIDAIGCDFGIADGEICLFEVNSYPGIKGCLEAATDAKLAFHRSLLQLLQNSSNKSLQNLKDWSRELAKLSQVTSRYIIMKTATPETIEAATP